MPAETRRADERVARNLLTFARMLRDAGVPVDATRARLALSALAELGLEHEPDVRAACRAVLVSRHTDIPAFEATFDRFWALLRGGTMPPGRTTVRLPKGPLDVSVPLVAPSGRGGASVIEHTIRVVASPAEVLRGTDFAAMTPAERAAAARFLDRLRWTPGLRPSRRYRPARHGERLDARGTMRRSLGTGGEPLALLWRARREKRRPLVILCDISGSMEAYTRLFLHLAHGLTRGWGRVEVFTFGTRLTRVTRQLRERRPDAAIARVSRTVADWSGGTRIGEAVGEFNRRWSRRVLGRGAIVLFLSDGWERGDPEILAAEMARLQRGSYRLIWLNPLSGTRDYAPAASGAQAIVRFVDDHLPSNTLEGLLHVGLLLERVGRGRPTRRAEHRAAG
ncbi:MAG: uncharacterized protein QOH08_2103 [Chloroflexota bacterium]|nr:uncharacterized protein [Chloroflexota bacterium]